MNIDRYRSLRRISPCLLGFTALGLIVFSTPGSPPKAAAARVLPAILPGQAVAEVRYDPRAALLLKRMGEAYSHLGSLDLQIDASAAFIPLETVPDSAASATTNVNPTPFHVDESTLRPQNRLHLAFRQSNHLLLETEQTDALTGQKFDLRWICDGQYFWSYAGDKKIYTREKAPGSIHDFARLKYLNSGTLELMMLIGPNPFAELLQSVEGAHLAGEADVRGIPTEVVSLQMENPLEQSEMRLYIGKADSLLHRMEIESIPVKLHEGPVKVGSKLDALLDTDKPIPIKQEEIDIPGVPKLPPPDPPKPHKPMGSFLRFDNDLTLAPTFAASTFAFVPPKGSLMLGEQGPIKRLTMKQRIALLAKNARQQRAEMLHNGQN